MPTEMELTLEQTQQGVSYEVSVDPHGLEGIYKDGHGGTCVKVKEIQERCIIKAFKLSYQEKYEHVGPKVTRSQEGKRSQDDDDRLCLVDDLKKFKITFMSSQRCKSKPKVNDHYIISQAND
ncbi:hypothetical protein Tco_1010268 [Tanacetum coccineum]